MASTFLLAILCACVGNLVHVIHAADEPDSLYKFEETSEVLRAEDGRIRGAKDRKNKDFVLGGLFPIHSDNTRGARCEDFRLQGGLERMEAMLFALDRINEDEHLLPNLTVGYDIRDTCYIETVGLDEALDLILISNNEIESDRYLMSHETTCGSGSSLSEIVMEYEVPTVGILGAAASRVSLPVATLGRLFQMPQISYSSTSALLSNRDRYSYFYRTIEPDPHQVRAMIALMLRFNWTYVSIVYSNNAYGQPAMDELRELAVLHNICIDLDEGIDDVGPDFDELAEKLNASKAAVVVLFASSKNAEELLNKMDNCERKFIWIASDGWAEAVSVLHQFNKSLTGMFGTVFQTQYSSEFDTYYSQLTIDSNKRNPWFSEFYAAFADCDLNVNCNSSASLTQLPHYEQGNIVPLVIDAVYAFAHALHNFLMENCGQPLTWSDQSCSRFVRNLNGSTLLEYLGNVEFTSPTGNATIIFGEDGDPLMGSYTILNYQAETFNSVQQYSLQTIGIWQSSVVNDSTLEQALHLYENVTIQFGIDSSEVTISEPPISTCNRCEPGQYRRDVKSSCCGICDPCLGRYYSNVTQAMSCINCSSLGEMWGNNPLHGSDHCIPISETFLRFGNPWSILVTLLSILGLLATLTTAAIFGIYWRTPVIQASSREQMVLLLVGITLSFILVFLYIIPPNPPVCVFQRFGFWLCFSLMFAALLIKTIRIARIFLQRSSFTRLRFTGSQYQVLFTLVIVLVQIILVIGSVGHKPPGINRSFQVNRDNPSGFPTIAVTCVPDSLIFLVFSVVYETTLVILSTIFGSISFKFPENFNEAKQICCSTFALLVIWLAFVPTYFATAQSQQELQNVAISFTTVLTALSILIFIFGPKVYIVLFQQERNRKHFSRNPQKELNSSRSEYSLQTASSTSNVTTPTSTTVLSSNSGTVTDGRITETSHSSHGP